METPTRQHDGRFPIGVSGNPSGRTKGRKNRATYMAEALLEGECRALVRKAIELALGGDLVALKLCLERLLPRRHERTLTFQLPPSQMIQDKPPLPLGQSSKVWRLAS